MGLGAGCQAPGRAHVREGTPIRQRAPIAPLPPSDPRMGMSACCSFISACACIAPLRGSARIRRQPPPKQHERVTVVLERPRAGGAQAVLERLRAVALDRRRPRDWGRGRRSWHGN